MAALSLRCRRKGNFHLLYAPMSSLSALSRRFFTVTLAMSECTIIRTQAV